MYIPCQRHQHKEVAYGGKGKEAAVRHHVQCVDVAQLRRVAWTEVLIIREVWAMNAWSAAQVLITVVREVQARNAWSPAPVLIIVFREVHTRNAWSPAPVRIIIAREV